MGRDARLTGTLSSAALPIYMQIRDALIERIQSGELAPRARIPSERELADGYHVSRMTVRQAIVDLVNRGLARRIQGNGTYVTEPKTEQALSPLLSFSEQMTRQGLVPGARLLEVTLITVNKKLGEALQVGIGDRVYRIIRVRTGNGQPIALETSHFPSRLCPKMERLDLERRSIYRILEEEYDVRVVRAVQSIEPTVANEFEAQALAVAAGSPLLLLERTAYTRANVPVEFAKDLYRGDRSRFVTEMEIRHDPRQDAEAPPAVVPEIRSAPRVPPTRRRMPS